MPRVSPKEITSLMEQFEIDNGEAEENVRAGYEPIEQATTYVDSKFVTVWSPVGPIKDKLFESSRVLKSNLHTDYTVKKFREGPNRGQRAFYTVSELPQGWRAANNDDARYECPVANCTKRLRNLYQMKAHLMGFHSREYDTRFKEKIEVAIKKLDENKTDAWLEPVQK